LNVRLAAAIAIASVARGVTHDCESTITRVMREVHRIHKKLMKSQQHRH
jgi:hypothetical protein